jgi:hypothetical protein
MPLWRRRRQQQTDEETTASIQRMPADLSNNWRMGSTHTVSLNAIRHSCHDDVDGLLQTKRLLL